MKRILATLIFWMIVSIGQTAFALSGLFFSVVATGTPANVNISLCLNGKGPLSCQQYNVSASKLKIATTILNHYYPAAGIKINTPGYKIADIGVVCTPISNGYCLFSISNMVPKLITIYQSAGYTISGTISGLTASGLVLQNNGKDNLAIPSGATSFQFSTPVAYKGTYKVTIKQQPRGLRCLVTNGSGVVTGNVSNVGISCHVSNAYVANFNVNTVTPVTLATQTPGAPISVDALPVSIAVTPDGVTAYVTDNGSNLVTPITVATNVAGTPITVGSRPYGIAITPDGLSAYTANYNDGTVTPISLITNTAGTPISVGQGPIGIAITPDGSTAYVSNNTDGTVTPINLATNMPGTPIVVGNGPWLIAITPDGTMAYVVNSVDGTVTPIVVATNSPGTPISVGPGPLEIVITPDGSTAYVTNNASNNITPITLATNTAGTPITVGAGPYGIAITADGTMLYVAIYDNGNGNKLVPVTVGTNVPGAAIPVGASPTGVAIS